LDENLRLRKNYKLPCQKSLNNIFEKLNQKNFHASSIHFLIYIRNKNSNDEKCVKIFRIFPSNALDWSFPFTPTMKTCKNYSIYFSYWLQIETQNSVITIKWLCLVRFLYDVYPNVVKSQNITKRRKFKICKINKCRPRAHWA
jgi:hypothetical protein